MFLQVCHPPHWLSSQTVVSLTPDATMNLKRATGSCRTSAKRVPTLRPSIKPVGHLFPFPAAFLNQLAKAQILITSINQTPDTKREHSRRCLSVDWEKQNKSLIGWSHYQMWSAYLLHSVIIVFISTENKEPTCSSLSLTLACNCWSLNPVCRAVCIQRNSVCGGLGAVEWLVLQVREGKPSKLQRCPATLQHHGWRRGIPGQLPLYRQ